MPPVYQPQIYQPTEPTAYQALAGYFTNLYPLVLDAIIRIFGALIIFLIGWIVALVIKLAIEFILEKIRIKDWLAKANLDKYFESFAWEERLDKVLAEVVFWIVFIVFLMTAFDTLGLQVINSFISRVVNYIPTALVGGLILLAGFLFGELVRKVSIGVFRGLEKKSADLASSLVKWAIVVFAFLAALSQWGIASDIVNTLVMGLVFFVALAGGLAFGLGGQNLAKEILENFRKQIH